MRWAGLRSFGAVLTFVAIGLSVGPMMGDYILNTDGLLSWIVHFRFIGNNGFLTAHYFSFFEDAAKALYQDSFGRFFFDPVYNRPIAEMVGSSFSIEGNHANANLWGDGYGNLGVLGVLFASLSLVGICWLLDSLTDLAVAPVAIAPIVAFGFSVANNAVHSVMTSNGGWLMILLLLLMPGQKHFQRS